jgi:ectoine hydroxylase-related dioxygenase (phytanoyl-CoA dioxygenase family)
MKLLKDVILNNKLQDDGFVVISLVDELVISELSKLYKQIQPISNEGFSSTIFNHDLETKRLTSEKISDLLRSNVSEILNEYRPLGASFLCKTPGENSGMPVHQDWTIVDELKFGSYTIWIPLVDVNEHNGAMKVLPGSHKFSNTLRSPTLPGSFQAIENEIYEKMVWVKIKAGQAIVFNQAILHASPPNLSKSERVVATFGCIPIEAEMSFFHQKLNGKVEEYAVNDDFFLTYNNIGQAPENGVLIRTFDYKFDQFTIRDLMSSILDFKQKKNKMKPLFKDPQIQEFFNKNGFVKFKMLDDDDVKELYEFFMSQNLRDHSGYGFNMSMEDDDKEKVSRIRKKIFEVALPKALPHFENAKVIAGSFVVKEKNPQGVVPPHQDWTFVENEGEYYSVTCWIPLVPTRLENGYMGVIKGSHLIYDNIRPSPSPQVPTPLMNHLFAIFPYLEMYEMQPGEALIFDHRTFHASTPNITNDPRVAIGLGFTQADAPICHYSLKQNSKKDTLLKYKVDDEFLLKYDNSKISRMYDNKQEIEGYEIAEELPYVYPNPTTEELLGLIKAAGNTFNIDLCEHMAKLFNFNPDGTSKTSESETLSTHKVEVEKRSFWKLYTPMNILREVKFRITGK